MEQENWFKEEFERAKQRNAEIPPHARMIVTSPVLSAHSRSSSPIGPEVGGPQGNA